MLHLHILMVEHRALVLLFHHALRPSTFIHWNKSAASPLLHVGPTYGSSSFVSFTQFSPTCGRMPFPAMSLWPGHQPCRPRLVDGRRGGGPSSVAPRSRNPPTGRHRDSPVFARPTPVRSRSPTEPVLSRSSRQRLGHLQFHFDGGWHVCQAVFPEPHSAAACRRVERRDCAHEALPRLQSASSWLVMEQLVTGVWRLSCAFHAAGDSPPDARRSDTGQ